MLMRRGFLILPTLVLLPHTTLSQQTLEGLLDKDGRDADGRKLGDDKFLHKWLHASYQEYFPTQKCECHDGECRPTTWRRDPKNARILQAWINGGWVSVGEKTKIRDKNDIPAGFPELLLKFSAHACAYGAHPNITLSCLWILNAGV
jgi:hypothetical protein